MSSSGRRLLLAVHGAEQRPLRRHEAPAHQARGAAGAAEAARLGVPVVLAVGDPLGLGRHRQAAGGAGLGRRGETSMNNMITCRVFPLRDARLLVLDGVFHK